MNLEHIHKPFEVTLYKDDSVRPIFTVLIHDDIKETVCRWGCRIYLNIQDDKITAVSNSLFDDDMAACEDMFKFFLNDIKEWHLAGESVEPKIFQNI